MLTSPHWLGHGLLGELRKLELRSNACVVVEVQNAGTGRTSADRDSHIVALVDRSAGKCEAGARHRVSGATVIRCAAPHHCPAADLADAHTAAKQFVDVGLGGQLIGVLAVDVIR